ncbi:unnamed protein product [Closterium sp. NIES-53]
MSARGRDVKGVLIPLRGKQHGAEMRSSGRKETKLELPILEDLQGKNRITPRERRTSRATHQVSGVVKAVGRGKASDSDNKCRDRRQRCSRRGTTREAVGGQEEVEHVSGEQGEMDCLHLLLQTETAAAAAAAMTPPLLSPDARTVSAIPAADAAAAAAVTPPLLSPYAPTETVAATAAVPSQTAPAPPSPTCLNATLRLQCPLQEHPQAPQRPAAEANEERTAEQTGSKSVRRGEAAESRQPCPPQERSPLSHPLNFQSWHHGLKQPQYPHPSQLHLLHPQTR